MFLHHLDWNLGLCALDFISIAIANSFLGFRDNIYTRTAKNAQKSSRERQLCEKTRQRLDTDPYNNKKSKTRIWKLSQDL